MKRTNQALLKRAYKVEKYTGYQAVSTEKRKIKAERLAKLQQQSNNSNNNYKTD